MSFLCVIVKTVLSVTAVLILAATTPAWDLSRALTMIGCPRALSLQFVMTYRYILILADEAGSMRDAYALRSGGAGGLGIRDMGPFVGNLLLRGIDRSVRVYSAMRCKGFDGSYPGAPGDFPGVRDWLYLFAVTGYVILVRCFI